MTGKGKRFLVLASQVHARQRIVHQLLLLPVCTRHASRTSENRLFQRVAAEYKRAGVHVRGTALLSPKDHCNDGVSLPSLASACRVAKDRVMGRDIQRLREQIQRFAIRERHEVIS